MSASCFNENDPPRIKTSHWSLCWFSCWFLCCFLCWSPDLGLDSDLDPYVWQHVTEYCINHYSHSVFFCFTNIMVSALIGAINMVPTWFTLIWKLICIHLCKSINLLLCSSPVFCLSICMWPNHAYISIYHNKIECSMMAFSDEQSLEGYWTCIQNDVNWYVRLVMCVWHRCKWDLSLIWIANNTTFSKHYNYNSKLACHDMQCICSNS